MAASVSTATSTATSTNALELSNDINELIISKMHYSTIYRFHLEGNVIFTRHLLKEGKSLITHLENLIHPDAGYSPIGADFDFTNLDLITKHIWNMLICVSNTNSDMHQHLLYHVCGFISMECDAPDLYNAMFSDIWESIILLYLDSEYDSTMESLGGYKKWKYIFRAIERYTSTHGLDTLAKQKYALSILIMTYLEYKDTIMNMYEDEYKQIDTNEKYYDELRNLVAVVSGNGHLGTSMISREFVNETFYFMSE
jgi:hypothetical protein